MGEEERRQHPRVECRFPASAYGPRGPVRGFCTNLSVGGLFLEGVVLGQEPVTAVVTVEFPTGNLSFHAQVRRVSKTPRGTGFQFLRLEPQHVAALQKYTTK